MAKVIGKALSIVFFLVLVGQIFMYQNSSAHLQYNPADRDVGLADVGLILPMVMSGIFFLIGWAMFKFSSEPENY